MKEEQVGPFMAALRDQYYTPLLAKGVVTETQMPGVRRLPGEGG